VRERLNKGTTVAPTGAESESAAATKVPGAVRDKTTKAKQPASDPMQDALARQVLAMPGVSTVHNRRNCPPAGPHLHHARVLTD
jgi:hypothetical protein